MRHISAFLASIVAVVLISWYVISLPSQPSNDPRSGPDVRIELMIGGHKGVCSGVYIGNGVILTARHCATKDVTSAKIIFDFNGVDGAETEAKPLWVSDKTDIGAYEIENLPQHLKYAELACRDPKIGEQIEVVGNPLKQTFIHTWGKVAGVIRSLPADKDGTLEQMVPIDAMVGSGNSGGPVYDLLGRVLGIVSLVIEDSFAIGPQGIHAPSAVGHVDVMVSSQAACEKFSK